MAPFRPSIVLSGAGEAWSEERWARFTSSEGVPFRRLKPCPRCTVPCRDQTTGGFIVKAYPLLPTAVMSKAWPEKRNGYPEWGSWQGPIFGTYYSHGGCGGVLRVGEALLVEEPPAASASVLCGAGACAGLLAAALLAQGFR